LQEVSPGRRIPALFKRLLKYAMAAVLYSAGLTGPLLRRTLESGHTCLILGFHGTTDAEPGYFSRGHAIFNVRDQLAYLSRHLRHATLEEIALAVSRGESPPAASFAVTFDDGIVNNVTLAIPMLQELNLAATFFIPSALVGSSRDLWVSSLRELVRRWQGAVISEVPGLWPKLPVADEAGRYAAYFRIKEALKSQDGRRREVLDRLAQEAGGYIRPPEDDRVVGPELLRRMTLHPFTVGAHSRTHPILSAMETGSARAEIDGSRKDLEQMLGRPVLDFAYPNGRFPDLSDTTCRLVGEAGYRCAVSTEPGTVRRGDDRLALRRCLPGNVPAFLASFELLSRAWADRHRQGDLARPLGRRISYLGPREARFAS
jgi:peptidoglycan/xylan/chitin deacetylase (PgdA/CDA1 family)